MLNVNNKEVINRTALKTIKANKIRNLFIVIAIALTTVLITSVFSIGMGFLKTMELMEIRIKGTTAHAVLQNPTKEQLEKLLTFDYIKAVGEQYHVASVINTPNMKNMSISLYRCEENEWENHRKAAITGFTGNLPQKYNEIMMPVWVLNTMGIENPEIGMEIPIQYQYENYDSAEEQTFVLSAYFTDYINIRSGNFNYIYVSDEFAGARGNNVTNSGYVSITFKDDKKVNEYVYLINETFNLSERQKISISPEYTDSNSAALATAAGFFIIIFIIIVSGYLLIYNILYISVTKDIRFYGLLKTIGTTPRQLRRIVTRQAVILSLIGIPIGLIAGALLSFAVVPIAMAVTAVETGAVISFNPVIFIGAAFFSFITTWLSAIKPARTVGKITPVEAVRFTSRTIRKSNKKGTNGGKIHKMAFTNIFRDKKRALTVFTSLFLGLTIFLVISTILSAMDVDNLIAEYMEHDFILENRLFFSNDKFSGGFISELENTEGITGIETVSMRLCRLKYVPELYEESLRIYYESANLEMPARELLESEEMGYMYTRITKLDKKDIEEINKTLTTPIDIEAFERGDFVLLKTHDPSIFKIGSEIEGTITGTEESYDFSLNIGGFITQSSMHTGMLPEIYASEELFIKITNQPPTVQKIMIDCDPEFSQSILQQLKSMTGYDNDVSIESKIGMAETLKSSKTMMSIIGNSFAVILALIGILNFVNVMVTNVETRSVELAMLESIGMTKKQLKKMLMCEGIGYFIISSCLVLTAGSGIAFGIFTLFKQQATYAVFSYPIIPILSCLIIVLAVCVLTPLFSFKSSEKETVIGRLRKAE